MSYKACILALPPPKRAVFVVNMSDPAFSRSENAVVFRKLRPENRERGHAFWDTTRIITILKRIAYVNTKKT